MLQRMISSIVVVALASVAFAQQPPKIVPVGKSEKSESNEAIRAALKLRISSVNFKDISLKDAIEFLRDVTGANIHVNWRAIEKSGVDRDTKLDFHVRDVSLEKALNLVLGDSSIDLAWVIDDGVIEISTAEAIRDITCIKIYDVRDLLEAKWADRKEEMLMTVISEFIDPASWVQNGGKCVMTCHDGKLIVQQAAVNHQAIASLLEGLRQFRDESKSNVRSAGGQAASGTGEIGVRR